jgi:hypothetical protein
MSPGRYYIRLTANGPVTTPAETYRLTLFLIEDAFTNPYPADTGVGVDTFFPGADAGSLEDAGSPLHD